MTFGQVGAMAYLFRTDIFPRGLNPKYFDMLVQKGNTFTFLGGNTE